MRQQARACNLAICYRKRANWHQFFCASADECMGVCYHLVDPQPFWQRYDKIHDQCQDRCMKNWRQIVKLKKIWLLVFLGLMEVSKVLSCCLILVNVSFRVSELKWYHNIYICLYFLRWLPPPAYNAII